MRRGFISFLVCWLWLAQARGDETVDAEALASLKAGIAAFKAGDLPTARAAFARARDLAPERANPYRWLGMTLGRLGQCAEAVPALDTYLKLARPDDPRIPDGVALRDSCKAMLGPVSGTVIVESIPVGAEVRVDQDAGLPAGTTPYKNDILAPGTHTVHLRKTDFASSSRVFSIERGETVKLNVVLRPAPVVAVARPPVAAAPTVKPAALVVPVAQPDTPVAAPSTVAGTKPSEPFGPPAPPPRVSPTAPQPLVLAVAKPESKPARSRKSHLLDEDEEDVPAVLRPPAPIVSPAPRVSVGGGSSGEEAPRRNTARNVILVVAAGALVVAGATVLALVLASRGTTPDDASFSVSHALHRSIEPQRVGVVYVRSF